MGARELFWRSEKTKWEAKGAKLDYDEKVRHAEEEKIAQVLEALDREGGPEEKAVKLMEKGIKMVDKSREITSINIETDGQDTDPHSPSPLNPSPLNPNPLNPNPLISPVGPKRKLGPLTVRKGRMFR